MFDVRAKHKTEMQLHYIKMEECRHHFDLNRCEDPVPQVRDFCKVQEKCLIHDSNFVVKNVNILTGLIVESLNAFASEITNRALFVLVIFSCTVVGLSRLYASSKTIVQTTDSPTPMFGN